jgi:hypothetical protein
MRDWADTRELSRSDLIMQSGAAIGRFTDSATRYKEQLAAAGFTNIQETIYKWPQNRWPKDPKYKQLGMLRSSDILGG